jgi:hypothetical protein
MTTIEKGRSYHVKSGIKTTEFWITALVVGTASMLVIFQASHCGFDSSGAVAIGSAAASAIGYARSRAAVKAGG